MTDKEKINYVLKNKLFLKPAMHRILASFDQYENYYNIFSEKEINFSENEYKEAASDFRGKIEISHGCICMWDSTSKSQGLFKYMNACVEAHILKNEIELKIMIKTPNYVFKENFNDLFNEYYNENRFKHGVCAENFDDLKKYFTLHLL